MDRKGGGRGGPSFDNESINLGIYIYIYIHGCIHFRENISLLVNVAQRVKTRFFRIFFRRPPFFPKVP